MAETFESPLPEAKEGASKAVTIIKNWFTVLEDFRPKEFSLFLLIAVASNFGMPSSLDLAAEVESVLKARREVQEKPNNDVLLLVFQYLVSQSTSNSSAALSEEHWYCRKTSTPLVREAATYLIFLFAFQRQGTSKTWVDKLEVILGSCEGCARGFAAARRLLGTRYLSDWPIHVKEKFFAAVDRWQSGLIIAVSARAVDPGYRKAASRGHALYSLPLPILQLLLGEPSLLSDPGVSKLLEDVFQSEDPPPANLAALGISPVHARLLSSQDSNKRQWCINQLRMLARRPISFDDWCSLDIGVEIQELFNDRYLDGDIRWGIIKSVIEEKVLDQETIEKGLLGGQVKTEVNAKTGRGLMSVLSGLLNSDVPYFPAVFSCFASLLCASPTRHVWLFDPSPELPHTLLSELRANPTFQTFLGDQYFNVFHPDKPAINTVELRFQKDKVDNKRYVSSLNWLGGFILSVMDMEQSRACQSGESRNVGFAFAATLAVAMNMVFQELQHTRLSSNLRSTASRFGFEALICVYEQLNQNTDPAFDKVMTSTLNLHSGFITTVAFRPNNHPSPIWSESRQAARHLLTMIFQADAQSIRHCFLSLAEISYKEKKRMRKKSKGIGVPSPNKVEYLPLLNVRNELWSMAYDALSPADASGAAVLIQSLAFISHLELLDRSGSWSHHGLEEVVKKEEWIKGIQVINSALRATRESFHRVIEALASQADSVIIRPLWNEPGIPQTMIILLLSPDDEIHTPVISVIQQSFEEVDDRSDCFRAILREYPAMAVDGLNVFLHTFLETAKVTPESCSLAKWMVRCFHDVLEVLCRPSGSSEPFLQSIEFLSFYCDGKSMAKRLEELWNLMTISLALIFKRTLDWAPYFDNEVMVDWMRDALIFGRQMTDHLRSFEAAILGTSLNVSDNALGTPAKQSMVGKKMIKQLEIVLTDLILWIRLTDVETLFQTHQFVKTILSRISKTSTNLSKNPALEKALLDIDKFCRKASRSFTSRLTDDLLSELSELLEPFSVEDPSEVQFIKKVDLKPLSNVGMSHEPISKTSKMIEAKQTIRNAFTEMMKASGSQPAYTSKAPNYRNVKPAVSSKTDPHDFENDDFLSKISASDLDIIEKRAIMKDAGKQGTIKPSVQSKLQTSARALAPSSRLHLDLTSKPPPPKYSSSFQSKVMKELRREYQTSLQDRRRAELGQIAPKLPTASTLGTGLGAYTGPLESNPPKPADSGSSASDSSEDEDTVLKRLSTKQKALPKPVKTVAEKRSIKILEDPLADIQRRNEERRAKAHATKMRLKPDFAQLYRYILAWDPSHSGPMAPHTAKFASEFSNMRTVPTTFENVKQYEQIMLPPFLQELWAQCRIDQGQPGVTIPVEVASRQYEDDFIEIDLSINGGGGFYCNDTDLVVLEQPKNPKSIFAKVTAFKQHHKSSTVRVRISSIMDQRELCGKAKWQMRKHVSLSTAIREFGALKGLPWYEPSLLSDILAGRGTAMPKLSFPVVDETMKSLNLNEPQARAVLGAMEVKGFALIQGPPGTGKTKTISGLIAKFMSERKVPMTVDGQSTIRPKLLVCAPSNAAIDEVCKRLILGVPNPDGGQFILNIVRVGIDASVNIAVKDVSLDNLVESKVNLGTGKSEGEYARIQTELDDVKQQIKDKQEIIRLAQDHDEKRKTLENDYHALITRRTQLGQALSKAKDAARDATRYLDGARRAARDQILNEADIVCATLSGAGHETLAAHTFETVIIDEAAQAIELSCLIPLKYGCRRCIMVGDPNQLPPTTFSTDAERLHYNKSLFVRMTKHSSSQVQLLSIQYRMHPFISELPSKVFYDGRLKDGPDMVSKTSAIWHERNIFGPYRFFHVDGTEIKAGTSTKNPDEALAAVELYRRLSADFGTKINLAMRVGVITMYKEQLWELKRKFTQAFGSTVLELVEFNTVDGFQGQEKDIIILSCVRSGPNLHRIGFLKDIRRMNVALTRAKSSLFIFGSASTLERSDERWKIIVRDAKDRGFFINYTSTTFSAVNIESTPRKIKNIPVSKSRTQSARKSPTATPDLLLPPKIMVKDISNSAKSKSVSSEDLTKEIKKKRKSSDSSPSNTVESKKSVVSSKPPSIEPQALSKPNPPVLPHSGLPRPRLPSLSHLAPSRAPRPPPPEDVIFIKKKKKRPNHVNHQTHQ
ncbi:uncharacterized protein L203_105644 [Cryptococcus depauperatus CBS 7841]|uniref:Senataxin n=1 Tax=Cryptococcus depauperatus CBS 7841 TaxID=1295531 RepID=A0AAJ8JXS8_9TREE